MTLREELKNKFQKDATKAPKKFFNQNNLEMIWSDKEKLYTGIDENGKEWIAALHQTTVPIYFVSCPNKIRKNNTEIDCRSKNIVAIFQEKDMIQCRECKQSFPVKLDISKSTQAYKILENLDK